MSLIDLFDASFSAQLQKRFTLNNLETERADAMELLCLLSKDLLFSLSDSQEFEEEQIGYTSKRGSTLASEQADKENVSRMEVLETCKSRSKSNPDSYPFNVSSNCIEYIGSQNSSLYIFLLLASNSSLLTRPYVNKIRLDFELLSKIVFREFFPKNSTVEIFGTSNKFENCYFRGNLNEKFQRLAKTLRVNTSRTIDESPDFGLRGGDAGIDLFSVIEFPDDEGWRPIAFGQSTCSIDKWSQKQFTISEDRLRSYLELSSGFNRYSFVPFYWRNMGNRFIKTHDIITILVDRCRILNMLNQKHHKADLLKVESYRVIHKAIVCLL
jgi:hypothetical protein